MKIGAIMAVSEGSKVLELRHFEYGRKFMKWCIANTDYHAHLRMADTQFERNMKKLLGKLNKSKGVLSMRDAYRHLHLSRREIEEIIATQTNAGQIEIVRDPDNEDKETIVLISGN
jgi:hypothetical protein